MLEKMITYMESLEKQAIPQLSVNCVIFGFHDKSLHVVVNKIAVQKESLTLLPGGFIGQREHVTDAVERIVRESTGLENILFKQFAVFGAADRSFRMDGMLKGMRLTSAERSIVKWVSKRFVSICFLALVDYREIELSPTQFLDAAQWLSVKREKELGMDHAAIVKAARETLLKEMPYTPIASNLLPARFTLPELHALVEAILGRPVDRPNFRRKILSTGMLVKVGTDKSSNRRPADVYKFKNGKNTSLMEEFKFGF